jgi:hypothetical protein
MTAAEPNPEAAGQLKRMSGELADEVLAEAAALSVDPTAPVSGEAIRQAWTVMTAPSSDRAGEAATADATIAGSLAGQQRAPAFSRPIVAVTLIVIASLYIGFTVFPAHLDRVAAVASLLGAGLIGYPLAVLRARAQAVEYQGLIAGSPRAPADAGLADSGLGADQDWEHRPLDPAADVDPTMTGLTELRCHGVSGPLPGSVLGFPEDMVTEVNGNADSGFWRRWMLGPEKDVPTQHRREAFCWGGLTSRASMQALWLLLLPFSLVNLAHWMVLPYAGDRDRFVARSAVVLLRVLALSLTGTLLLAGAEVTMDLGAWQCGQAASCRPKLLPFGLMNKEGDWPGLRLGAAALFLAVVLLLLWRAGLERFRPLQQASAAVEPTVALDRTRTCGSALGDPRFWAVDKSTRWLRGLHVLLWCAGTGAILAGVLISAVSPGSAVGRLGDALLALNLLVVTTVVALMLLPDRFGRGGRSFTSTTALRWFIPIGLALLAVTIGVTVGLLPGSADHGDVRMPGLQGAFSWLVLGQLLVLILLGGCVGWLAVQFRRRGQAIPVGYRPMLGGTQSFVLAFLGWFLALCYSAGIGLLAAGRFGAAVTAPTPGKAFELLVPSAYRWIEVAGVATSGVLVAGTIVIGGLRLLLLTPRAVAVVAAEQHPPVRFPDLAEAKQARARSAATIAVLAQSVEVAPWLLAVAGVTVAGVTGIAIWRYYATGEGLHAWFPPTGWLAGTSSVGTWLATTCTLALITLTYAAYRNQRTRRLVGILWDVTTFWPRANHPLTPACTAERSVPQLDGRIVQLTELESDRVVLSAHSQGAVLALAAVLRLGQGKHADRLGRVALLTFGCPLRRLYARCFPAYFSAEVLSQAAQDIGGRWINLWARTDPIGGAIEPIWHPVEPIPAAPAGNSDTVIAPDPLTLGVDLRTGEQVGVCGHSGYVPRPEYDAAVRRLSG